MEVKLSSQDFDDETKLLSLTNIGTIFIEEVFEVNKDIVEQLNLRMRGKNANQQIIMAFNPISKSHWLYDFTTHPPSSSIILHSTYKDNPFLSDEYVASLEELYTRNPAKARIYCDGEWGVNPEGLVFTNWKAEEFNVAEVISKYEVRKGIDLGYVDPTTVITSAYDEQGRRLFVFEEYYKRGQQLDNVEAYLRETFTRTKIYCDSAEPRSIEYFRKKGHNVVPCKKGDNSNKAKVSFLQNLQIIVLPSCENLINELENFSYIKSKKTGEYTDDTTHEWSHAIDALAYSYSNIYTQRELKTLDKALLGL